MRSLLVCILLFLSFQCEAATYRNAIYVVLQEYEGYVVIGYINERTYRLCLADKLRLCITKELKK